MTRPWSPKDTPEFVKITTAGWVRIIWRVCLLSILTFTGLAILLLVRLIERPIWKMHRPITPYITQFVCRNAIRIIGIGFASTGELMLHKGVVVANHASWLDIFSLNACKRIYFVSKSEIAKWPVIGWLARATGTVFIQRKSSKALLHKNILVERLRAGHRLLFFPEGTSTDGLRVLHFRPTLFEALFISDFATPLYVQPVTVIYTAPPGQSPQFFGWWGDMEFGPHFLTTLSAQPQGFVTVVYHKPVAVNDFRNRKELALHCEEIVRSALPDGVACADNPADKIISSKR